MSSSISLLCQSSPAHYDTRPGLVSFFLYNNLFQKMFPVKEVTEAILALRRCGYSSYIVTHRTGVLLPAPLGANHGFKYVFLGFCPKGVGGRGGCFLNHIFSKNIVFLFGMDIFSVRVKVILKHKCFNLAIYLNFQFLGCENAPWGTKVFRSETPSFHSFSQMIKKSERFKHWTLGSGDKKPLNGVNKWKICKKKKKKKNFFWPQQF